MITIHQEVAVDLCRDIQEMRQLGVKVGVAINPATPADGLVEVLPLVDLALVMTVNPGFGGQAFIPEALGKVKLIRAEAERLGLERLHIQVDGGIAPGTAPQAARAGANVLVAGSSVFRGAGTIGDNYRAIRRSLAVPA